MIHEFNCKRCGAYEWHYVDDCTGEHPRYCIDCENELIDAEIVRDEIRKED
jgi:hypothetical protein